MALGHVFWENCLTGLKRSKANNFCPLLLQHHPLFFFQDSDPSLSIEPRGHGIYPWSPDAHRDVPKVPRAVCFFLVNCYCSPCSPQLKMASAWRLEKGYFPIIPKLHALCLASGALPLEGLFCLLSLLCFV